MEQFRRRPRLVGEDPADFLPTDPLLLVKARELANRGHNPLARALRSANRLHERPTFVLGSAFFFVLRRRNMMINIHHVAISNQEGGLHYTQFSKNWR